MRAARIAAACIAVLVLAGCQGRAVDPAPTAAVPTSTSATPTATPTTTPDAAPPRTAIADEASCRALLEGDAEAQASIDGAQLAGQSYVDKEQAEKRSPLKPFIDAGGMVCAWGGAMEVGIIYAWAPISEEDAAAQQQKRGGIASAEDGWTRVETEDGGDYAFADGFWAYSFVNTSADQQVPDLLADIVANAPDPSNTVAAPTDAAADPDAAAEPADPPYLTSEGLGDLRIGQPIPDGNGFVTWSDDRCGAGGGGWSESENAPEHLTVITTSDRNDSERRKNDRLAHIVVYDDSIPTRSGIRVGDSEQRLLATYPGIESVDNSFGETVYVVPGAAGKVVFEIGSARFDDPQVVGTVKIISVLATGTKISNGLPGLPGDAWGGCAA